MTVEIVWNGNVHYRRPAGDPDLPEMQRIITAQRQRYGWTCYTVRVRTVIKPRKDGQK